MEGQSEIYNDRIDWNIRVELPGNESMHVAQAKVVGGGSSINGGTALRNAVRDFEEWVQLGNDAWAWEDVEPVYAALERDEAGGKKGAHPLTRMQLEEAGKIQRAFVADAMRCGFPWVEDLNVAGAEGTGSSPVCRENSRRISAADTFIDPIRNTKNFQLWPNTCVNRIAFADGNANGVVLADQRHISASVEVILSAGAVFQSGRVYGLSRLRVADASVIPTIPAANTMWTTMMFADRIGRSIRDQKPVGGVDHMYRARI